MMVRASVVLFLASGSLMGCDGSAEFCEDYLGATYCHTKGDAASATDDGSALSGTSQTFCAVQGLRWSKVPKVQDASPEDAEACQAEEHDACHRCCKLAGANDNASDPCHAGCEKSVAREAKPSKIVVR